MKNIKSSIGHCHSRKVASRKPNMQHLVLFTLDLLYHKVLLYWHASSHKDARWTFFMIHTMYKSNL